MPYIVNMQEIRRYAVAPLPPAPDADYASAIRRHSITFRTAGISSLSAAALIIFRLHFALSSPSSAADVDFSQMPISQDWLGTKCRQNSLPARFRHANF